MALDKPSGNFSAHIAPALFPSAAAVQWLPLNLSSCTIQSLALPIMVLRLVKVPNIQLIGVGLFEAMMLYLCTEWLDFPSINFLYSIRGPSQQI